MKWLLWLYPRAWRRRYGAEYLALVEELGPSPRVVADTLFGALRAHLERLPDPTPTPAPLPLEVAAATDPAGAGPAPRPLARTQPDQWESLIDQLVRQARERGAFDNLAGAGKPLPADDNPFAGEW
ncbi:MAG TPA: DnaJ family domain-containing protein, partial [Chloroflexota bacterium]